MVVCILTGVKRATLAQFPPKDYKQNTANVESSSFNQKRRAVSKKLRPFNPLSAKSDEHQISPNTQRFKCIRTKAIN